MTTKELNAERCLGRLREAAACSGGCVDWLLFSLLGVGLFVRVLTDNSSAFDSRHSGGLNTSAVIALLFIGLAAGLLVRRHGGVVPAILATLWICVWTGVAVLTRGASTETLREGVREASVVAVAVIVCNLREVMTPAIAVRLVQCVGAIPATIALYQLSTHTGMIVADNVRPNGTFAHPNSAAMFFAIATAASTWRYFDGRRAGIDGVFTALFAAALVATSSIDGLATVMVMLLLLGALRPGRPRPKIVIGAIAVMIAIAFFATPLGSQRISKETSTRLVADTGERPDTTLGWRLEKWRTMLPEWEEHPILGQGLGTTTTAEGKPHDEFAGALPHNEYLRYLVETGIIGAGLLLVALILLLRRLLRLRRLPTVTESLGGANTALLAIVVCAGCLVNALADNTFLNSPTCYAAAAIVVSVLSMRSGVERRAYPG